MHAGIVLLLLYFDIDFNFDSRLCFVLFGFVFFFLFGVCEIALPHFANVDVVHPPAVNGAGGLGRAAEAGHGGESVELLLLGESLRLRVKGWRPGLLDALAPAGLLLPLRLLSLLGIVAHRRAGRRGRRRAVGRRAGGVGAVEDVLAVDVDGIADKGGTSVAVARVTLLEPVDLELGLNLLEETHDA